MINDSAKILMLFKWLAVVFSALLSIIIACQVQYVDQNLLFDIHAN